MTERIEITTKDNRTEIWGRFQSGSGMYLGSVVFNGFRYIANVQDVAHFADFDTHCMAVQAVAKRCGFHNCSVIEVK